MGEKTYSLQGTIPPLPVPELKKTLERYLDSVKPHISKDEYMQTEKNVLDFQHGVGKQLQEELLKRAKNCRNWLADWWENNVYLDVRTSTAISFNMCGPLPFINDVWPPLPGSVLQRTPLMLWHFINSWKILNNEHLPIDKEKNGQPWCMEQSRSVFNTCVIPGIKRDRIARHFKTVSEGDCPSHIIVLRHGHIYQLDVLADDGDILTPPELESQLSYIFTHSEKSSGHGLGSLTVLDRTSWANARDHLINLDLNNQKHLDTIETSMFALAFDDMDRSTSEEAMLTSLCGDTSNKWFDKSFSIICYKNGTYAFNANHSPADGLSIVGVTQYIHQNLLQTSGMWNGSKELRKLQSPQEVLFNIDPWIESEVKRALNEIKPEADDLVLVLRNMTCFSKLVSKQLKTHPDTFIQLALQLTYYKVHSRPAATYETASTRRFYRGRTETVRSCTVESTEWSKAMLDPTQSSANRLYLFGKAMQKHNQLMADAMNGEGCDRHLLGLMLLSLEQGIPLHPIYTQPAWIASGGGGNFKLSTSLSGYTSVLGGAAPMMKDGYAVFYRIGNQECTAVVIAYRSSPETMTQFFLSTLEESIKDMVQLATTSLDTAPHKL